jgi:outer membrane protein
MVRSNTINNWIFRAKYGSVLLILALFSASAVYAEEKKEKSSSILDKLFFWNKAPKFSDDKKFRKRSAQTQKKGKPKKNFDESWLWMKAPKLPDGPMTLEESVAIALRYNRTIKSAYLNRITQKYSLAVSNDEFYPDLTITPSFTLGSTGPTTATDFRQDTYTYGTNFSATQKVKTGGTFTFAWAHSLADVEANVRPDLTSSWTLGFTQPLLKGAGIDINTVALRTARINDENNILSLQSTLISTITSIITTYRSYLQTYQKRGIAAESLERANKQLNINKALVDTGRLAGVELIQSEADIAQKEFDFLTSRNNLNASLLTLIQSLDINKQTKIIPVEEDRKKVKMIKPDYEKSMQIALANRTDYLQALNSYEVSKMDLMVAKNSRLWDLSFTGSTSLSKTESRFINTQRQLGSAGRADYSVGLSLAIPFGDRGRHSSYVSSSVGLENARIALRELKQGIEIDIKDRIRDIELKILQLGLARRARELSKRKLEAERVKLKAGLTTNFQIVSFQNDLVSAQNNETDSVIDYMNALTNFDQALGTTLKTWKIDLVDKPESWDSILQQLEENKFFNLDE